MRKRYFISIGLAVLWPGLNGDLALRIYAAIVAFLFIYLVIHIMASEEKKATRARDLAAIKTILNDAVNRADSDCTPPDDLTPPGHSPAAQ